MRSNFSCKYTKDLSELGAIQVLRFRRIIFSAKKPMEWTERKARATARSHATTTKRYPRRCRMVNRIKGSMRILVLPGVLPRVLPRDIRQTQTVSKDNNCSTATAVDSLWRRHCEGKFQETEMIVNTAKLTHRLTKFESYGYSRISQLVD